MENPKQKIDRQKRDAEILRLYPDLTLMEIGKKYDLTHERVRQILKKLEVRQVGTDKPEKVDIKFPKNYEQTN